MMGYERRWDLGRRQQRTAPASDIMRVPAQQPLGRQPIARNAPATIAIAMATASAAPGASTAKSTIAKYGVAILSNRVLMFSFSRNRASALDVPTNVPLALAR